MDQTVHCRGELLARQLGSLPDLLTICSQFGGDPDHVVINGASAGAGSVAHHLTAYGGVDEGLFHGAIVTSVFFPTQPYVSELEWQFDLILSQVGCSSAADPMSCLRGRDLATLQAANIPSPLPGTLLTSLPLFYWGPCTDGDLIRNYSYAMFENGDFIDVPVIIGTNNDGKFTVGYHLKYWWMYSQNVLLRGLNLWRQRSQPRSSSRLLTEQLSSSQHQRYNQDRCYISTRAQRSSSCCLVPLGCKRLWRGHIHLSEHSHH